MSPPRHGEDSQCSLEMEPTYVMLGPEASQANKYSFLCAPIALYSYIIYSLYLLCVLELHTCWSLH